MRLNKNTCFCYMCYNEDKTRLTEYSKRFKHISEANTWYNNHGKKLEEMFNRELILV